MIEFNPQKRVADEAEEDDEDAESVEVSADKAQEFKRAKRPALKPPDNKDCFHNNPEKKD